MPAALSRIPSLPFNPYITVDFVTSTQTYDHRAYISSGPNPVQAAFNQHNSFGRNQPFNGSPGYFKAQGTVISPPATQPGQNPDNTSFSNNTFYQVNANNSPGTTYNLPSYDGWSTWTAP